MPDYFPLFDSTSGKRVFNATGMPVFARVRSGNAGVPITITSEITSAFFPGTPTGTSVVNNTFSLARISYGTFSSFSPSSTSEHIYQITNIGQDSGGTTWYLTATIFGLSLSYNATDNRMQFVVNFGVKMSTFPTYGVGGFQDNFSKTLYKTSNVYFPEGDYTTPSPTGGTIDGMTATISIPSSVTFTEA